MKLLFCITFICLLPSALQAQGTSSKMPPFKGTIRVAFIGEEDPRGAGRPKESPGKYESFKMGCRVSADGSGKFMVDSIYNTARSHEVTYYRIQFDTVAKTITTWQLSNSVMERLREQGLSGSIPEKDLTLTQTNYSWSPKAAVLDKAKYKTDSTKMVVNVMNMLNETFPMGLQDKGVGSNIGTLASHKWLTELYFMEGEASMVLDCNNVNGSFTLMDVILILQSFPLQEVNSDRSLRSKALSCSAFLNILKKKLNVEFLQSSPVFILLSAFEMKMVSQKPQKVLMAKGRADITYQEGVLDPKAFTTLYPIQYRDNVILNEP